jgi:hypothetical protein
MEFVSVTGTAKISLDREKMQQLWSESYKAWFPQGIGDPNICLLCVEVTSAEYWDSPGAKVVQLFGFLKAKLTGEKADLGEHRHVDVTQAAKTAKTAG